MEPAPNSGFNFEEVIGADEKMIEYSKMVVLLAINEFPNDDYKKCELVSIKFEEKYGGCWGCSFLKNGDTCYVYQDYFIKLRYNDYIIKILKTKN